MTEINKERCAKFFEHLKESKMSWSEYVSFILYGRYGTAKTSIACTAPQPIHFDMFDLNGALAIKSYLKEHPDADIRVNTFYPDDHAMDGIAEGGNIFGSGNKADRKKRAPEKSVFKKYTAYLESMLEMGYFDTLGTYVLDSFTMFNRALFDWILREEGVAFHPGQNHYNPATARAAMVLALIAKQNCHFILICHQTENANPQEQINEIGILAPGKRLREETPSQFGELYYVQRDNTTKLAPVLHTQPHKRYAAQTKIGHNILQPVEEPNITNILKRCGYSTETKTTEGD